MFGSFSRSWVQRVREARKGRQTWMPRRICLTVMAGRQSFSSSRIERQTVPEG